MAMLKRILLYILTLSILGGCSDFFDVSSGSKIGADGEVTVFLSIPAPVSVVTRAGEVDPECVIKTLDVLIYSGEEENTNQSAPSQYIHVSGEAASNEGVTLTPIGESSGRYQLSFKLNKELRNKSGLQFYFIANCAQTEPELGTWSISNLTDRTVSSISIAQSSESAEEGSVYLTMSGKAAVSDIMDGKVVSLYRNAAKVTVSNKQPTPFGVSTATPEETPGEVSGEDSEEDTSGVSEEVVYYPVEIFGADAASSVISGVIQAGGAQPNPTYDSTTPDSTTPSIFPQEISESTPRYFHPTTNTLNEGKWGGRFFIITKAQFDGIEYYYRLDFLKKKAASDEVEYISAVSNHWYQFIILKVTGKGYKTPAEASLHPANGIKYEIHDHCIESYNMISDGVRELGVSHEIEYQGAFNADNEWSDQKLFIKFFSEDDGEIPTAEQLQELVTIKYPLWLEISEATLVDDDNITGGEGIDSDSNNKGKVYSINLRFKPVTETGTLNNTITVKWLGLEREVPVKWIRKFNGAEVSSASLAMSYYKNDQKVGEIDEISDYWGFLSSTDESIGEDTSGSGYNGVKLWGIQQTPNNGKVRTEGFHFPVMYGTEKTGYAKYTYTLTFTDEKFKTGEYTAEINFEEGWSDVSYTIKQGKPLTIELTSGANDYTYATGELDVNVTFTDSSTGIRSTETYSFALYHTGFFHKDSEEVVKNYQLEGPKDYTNYFYYEVVPVMVDGNLRYILDRNLSAKSAQDYIRDADGATVAGNPDAAGGYYIVAQQKTLYEDPTMIGGITPPGYRVPKKNAWDAIRLSSSFHTENTGEYFPAYYNTGKPEIGNIYFPKSMLYLDGTYMGESRSGYYWTETASSGTEKEEIGRWLNMFFLTGNSTSFINGFVLVNDKNSAYGGSVRCINDQADETTPYRTSFNVNGATHVFLYTEEEGVRIPTTSWPGHAIGNYATMTESNWFDFMYSSTQFNPKDLYVIFNFVDEKGIIHTYSHNAEGETQKTTNLSPTSAQGWKVIGESNQNIKPSEDLNFEGNIKLTPATQSALGCWWKCGVNKVGDEEIPYVHIYTIE